MRASRSTPRTFYTRNLPHWHPAGACLFITWRLFGSLPQSAIRSMHALRTDTAGKRFRALDAELDKAQAGPRWLKDERVAGCVVEVIERGATVLAHYVLHAFVVMPNHVHLLIQPSVSVERITNGLKGVSARDANRILGRAGRRFWQDESFDHWVRSERQFERIRAYIELNPVHAGLVAQPKEWPWSSATSHI